MQKIGLGLVVFGLGFILLGITLFFDKGLLAMGNVLFLAGIIFIIGVERTYRFFFQSHKLKGTAFFSAGICLVLIGWPIIGMIIEFYGAFLLFGGLLPHAILLLRRMPVIGHILNAPGVKTVTNSLSDDSTSPA